MSRQASISSSSDVKLDGETKVQAVAGDCIDDAVFRKVETPNPAYKLGKAKSSSAKLGIKRPPGAAMP